MSDDDEDRTFGQTGRSAARGSPVPDAPDEARPCDFCGAKPTTRWVTFLPTPAGAGFALPEYLGACATCGGNIDSSNKRQLVELGNQPEDVADLLATYFDGLHNTKP